MGKMRVGEVDVKYDRLKLVVLYVVALILCGLLRKSKDKGP